MSGASLQRLKEGMEYSCHTKIYLFQDIIKEYESVAPGFSGKRGAKAGNSGRGL
jgi:hypothetical protein